MDNSKEKIVFQLRSLVVVRYFEIYKYLEEKTKNIFIEEVKNINGDLKNKLYFFYGGCANHSIDYSKNTLTMYDRKFNIEEDFHEFSFNQIIKICKNDRKIEKFNFNINSMQVKQEEFDFYSSCIKCMNMRNKLAHEVLRENFEDEDIIEILSDKNIEENVIIDLETLDIKLMDDTTKQIYSNLLYLNKIIMQLTSSNSLLEFIRGDEESKCLN